ncbi:MAG TPA: hypothetical protein VHF06_33300 [Pseudonocardiaceae bacterium]|jgi:hypothetical protein|nr:hypothetical protein [Pseudonocardiaceae bacterium]
MKRGKIAIGAVCAGLLLAGCSSPPSSTVPSLGGVSAAVSHGSQPQALHAAAQCIRDHGVPAYQDPVVAPDGSVYTDQRSLEDASKDDRGFLDSVRSACQSLFAAAGFNPSSEPKATPALVRAGVQAARCLRAHGMPNYRDPTASSRFTPGHGFGITEDEMPPGGKTSGVFQQAARACRGQLDAEIRASTLQSLSHG